MNLTFKETSGFSQVRDTYFLNDEGFRQFQNGLLRDPRTGTVMPGCGGVRKARWPDPRRGKGKRSGLRVIYLYVEEADTVLLIDVYDKDESDDLSEADKKTVAALARAFRKERGSP